LKVTTASIGTDQIKLLRLTTAGSVDDGKSTLIGRLLVDTKGAFEDQIAAARDYNEQRGGRGIDLALLTDGLRAEREQGITIDVAYRYFATPKRRFIIADTPGHEQYTRNMVTGASTAELALILVDARNGMVTQSRRHICIAHLLGITDFVIAINKMDLVDYSAAVFEDIKKQFEDFFERLGVRHARAHNAWYVPMSAFVGDMVALRGDRMPWYQGETLLELLESVEPVTDFPVTGLRFPVQLVSRPQTPELHDFRGYMGRIASGTVSVGDSVRVLPSGLSSTVRGIVSFEGDLPSVSAPRSVTLTLEDDLDISRGDMIVGEHEDPLVTTEVGATLCWMSEAALEKGRKYLIKHGSHMTKALVGRIDNLIDINTLRTDPPEGTFRKNDIGRIQLKTLQPLVCDPYRSNRETGSFVLIDPDTNATVACGMIDQPRDGFAPNI
jgi:sulfate adenylyltransferase subunit 1